MPSSRPSVSGPGFCSTSAALIGERRRVALPISDPLAAARDQDVDSAIEAVRLSLDPSPGSLIEGLPIRNPLRWNCTLLPSAGQGLKYCSIGLLHS